MKVKAQWVIHSTNRVNIAITVCAVAMMTETQKTRKKKKKITAPTPFAYLHARDVIKNPSQSLPTHPHRENPKLEPVREENRRDEGPRVHGASTPTSLTILTQLAHSVRPTVAKSPSTLFSSQFDVSRVGHPRRGQEEDDVEHGVVVLRARAAHRRAGPCRRRRRESALVVLVILKQRVGGRRALLDGAAQGLGPHLPALARAAASPDRAVLVGRRMLPRPLFHPEAAEARFFFRARPSSSQATCEHGDDGAGDDHCGRPVLAFPGPARAGPSRSSSVSSGSIETADMVR